MAAGSAQAARVPRIEDLKLRRGQRDNAKERTVRAGLSLVEHAPGKQPSEWEMPLQNDQRPDTSTPPSTSAALPRGAHTPAAMVLESPKISEAPSSGRYAESKLLVAAIETHQPVEASPRAIRSAPLSVVAGEASSAPSSEGAQARMRPVARSSSSSAEGSARSRSVAAASSRASADALSTKESSSMLLSGEDVAAAEVGKAALQWCSIFTGKGFVPYVGSRVG